MQSNVQRTYRAALIMTAILWGCSGNNDTDNTTPDGGPAQNSDGSQIGAQPDADAPGDATNPGEDPGATIDDATSMDAYDEDIHHPSEFPEIFIGEIPPGPLEPFKTYFSKYVNIFGIHIFASSDTPDDKVLHAARVMAHYLDNDKDGLPDNPAVVEAMISQASGSALIMFNQFDGLDNSGIFESSLIHQFAGQDLMGVETHPEGSSGQGGFDATLEEVLHLITSKGYANAYPNVFGEEPGSAIADAMDKARGGQLTRVPRRYPQGAWYHYDDFTCDYPCQVTEYFYWALTSILGAQSYGNRCMEINHEWEPCTREQVEERDPDIYALLTDPQYKLPTILPDGNYP